jgi:hypothetical protein
LIHGIDTSTTSNSISAASKTFTLDATAGQDQFWRTGDAVEASNGSNIMAGTVTSYDPATQSLVCNMTTASGTGTFTSWRIGYRGPRFDHDPVSRTNLFQYSEIFNEAASSNYWDSATANAVTSNQTTSPDGAATADLLTTSTTSFDCFVRRTINWVGSTQYSYSIFLKRGPSNHRYVGLYIGAGITGALHYPYFDFDNPTTVQIPSGTMVGTINSTRVNAYPNGWYRVSVTFTTAATPVTIYGGVYVSTSNGTLSSTPTAGLDCYIWGIQAETGSFPTSYIPTTTGTLARSADVCNITGDDFSGFYNQSEGTLTVKVEEFRRGTSYNTVVEIFNGLSYSGNRLGVVFGGLRSGVTSPLEISLFSGGPAQYQTATTSTSSGYTAAIAYATDNVRGSLNGNLLAADTPPSNVNIGANTIRFGSIGIHIAAVRFYKKRLPNAKLQALTV